jgi:hypothetical protein
LILELAGRVSAGSRVLQDWRRAVPRPAIACLTVSAQTFNAHPCACCATGG